MKKKILIVDDELPIRRLLEKMFCNEYEVFCAADGVEGLETIWTEDIRLIISDQRMPRMNGIEMFEKVVLTHSHITRILLSGYMERSDLKCALDNGVIHRFVAKPWSLVELKRIVAGAIENVSSERVGHTLLAA